jgi:hypothetical protein
MVLTISVFLLPSHKISEGRRVMTGFPVATLIRFVVRYKGSAWASVLRVSVQLLRSTFEGVRAGSCVVRFAAKA